MEVNCLLGLLLFSASRTALWLWLRSSLQKPKFSWQNRLPHGVSHHGYFLLSWTPLLIPPAAIAPRLFKPLTNFQVKSSCHKSLIDGIDHRICSSWDCLPAQVCSAITCCPFSHPRLGLQVRSSKIHWHHLVSMHISYFPSPSHRDLPWLIFIDHSHLFLFFRWI
jgi:hypothetical protein